MYQGEDYALLSIQLSFSCFVVVVVVVVVCLFVLCFYFCFVLFLFVCLFCFVLFFSHYSQLSIITEVIKILTVSPFEYCLRS